jgi:hypothetical protein
MSLGCSCHWTSTQVTIASFSPHNDFKGLPAYQWCVPPPLLFFSSLLSVDVDSVRDFTHPLRSSLNILTAAPMLLLGYASFAFFCTFASRVSQVVSQCQACPAHAHLDPADHHQATRPASPSISSSWHHTSLPWTSPMLSGLLMPV